MALDVERGLGFGAMRLSELEEGVALRLVHEAMDRGIRFFDTADVDAPSADVRSKFLHVRTRRVQLPAGVASRFPVWGCSRSKSTVSTLVSVSSGATPLRIVDLRNDWVSVASILRSSSASAGRWPARKEGEVLVEIAQSVAILAAGLFAGAAIYINVAEHPARMECGLPLAATVFGPSYRRAAIMQSVLALVGTVSGIVAGRLGGNGQFLLGAVLLFFVVPFTFIAIMGTNRRLLDARLEPTSDEASALLARWGRLHAVRSIAGFISFVVFVTAA